MKSMRKNTLIINGRFLLQDITGVQRVAREILLALDDLATKGFIDPPEVLVPAKGLIVAPLALESIGIKRVGKLTGHLWEQIELPRHARGHTLWCLGNSAPIASLFDRQTYVLTMIHDLSYKYFPSAYSWKFRALYSTLIPLEIRKSDIVITVSQSEKEMMSTYYPALSRAQNFHVVQNGGIPDVKASQAHASKFPNRNSREYGIFVGSLSKRKNAHGILKAAVKFLETYPNMRFVVIGATSNVFDSFEIIIPDAISERLEMRGQINDPTTIHEAFSKACFLLFPSFYEASPLPPVEAMTFGCPVIASDIPSLRERCGDAALYCDPNDDDSISAAIDRLIGSDELWNVMSRSGRECAAQYSWHKQTETLLRLSGIEV